MPVAPEDHRFVRTLHVGPLGTTFEVARGDAVFVCKRLHPRFVRDADARALLGREAMLLEKLDGRGAPALVCAGDDAHGPFLLTQRIEAPTLMARGEAERGGASTGRETGRELACAARAAFRALARVHEAADATGPLEVVHADLSPDNVLVDARSATIVDLAHAHWRDAPSVAGGAFRGTLLYAAPELARGEAVDQRCDLFALAASVLHAASGEPPRASSEPSAMLLEAAEAPLDGYARRAGATLDPDTAAALTRCLTFAREQRPARARDVFGASTEPC